MECPRIEGRSRPRPVAGTGAPPVPPIDPDTGGTDRFRGS